MKICEVVAPSLQEEEGLGPTPSSGKLYVVEGVELEDVSAAEENQTRISLVAGTDTPFRLASFPESCGGRRVVSTPPLLGSGNEATSALPLSS